MFYDVMVLADLHWCVMNENKHADELEFINYFLMNRPVDLLVIAGDYFDFNEALGSKRVIRSLDWFDDIYKTAKFHGVKKFRMFYGTKSHDGDQLEVFRKYEDEDGFFKLFSECTTEETLPNLQCLYCPDELISTKKYVLKYIDQLLSDNSMAFFHGSFDVVLKQNINLTDLMTEDNESFNAITSVTFPMNFLQKLIKGPIVGGHWHDAQQYGNIYYTGSPTRWAHNEMEPKGIGFVRMNLDNNTYYYQKIVNPLAPHYITFEVDPVKLVEFSQSYIDEVIRHIVTSIDEFNKAKEEYHIRIVVYQKDDSPLIKNIINILKDRFVHDQNIVVKVKDHKKKEKKKDKNKASAEMREDRRFIRDKNIPLGQKIHDFIKMRTSEDVPIEYIEEMIKKVGKM